MKDKEIKKFAIYSRKSKFTGKGESIDNQIEMCREYISSHYGEAAAHDALIYEDEGFSGGNLERPNFKKMMEDASASMIDAIVVYRLDRISRNVVDFATLNDQLNDKGIEFISIREQFDTTSPMGRAMMYVSSIFSQLERETIAERIRDNLHELAKMGRWLGGNTPTGYESEETVSISVDGKQRKACKLKVIPSEMTLVKGIFDKFFENGSLTKTDKYLLNNGIKTKTGIPFSRFAIKNILTNPVYMIADEDAYKYFEDCDACIYADKEDFDGKHGVMVYNRTLQKKGKSNKIRPMSEWIISVGKHEGMIPGTKWVNTQKLLELNRSKSYRKSRSNVALLSGVLYCADCVSYMRPKLTDRVNTAGERIYTYMCITKERSCKKSCDIANVRGNMLDAAVMNMIKGLVEDECELARRLESAKKRVCGARSLSGGSIAVTKAKIAQNEKEVESLALTLTTAEGSVAMKYVLEQIEKRHEIIESLKAQLAKLEKDSEEHSLTDIEFELTKEMLSSFSKIVERLSVEEKRGAIKMLVRKVVWDGEKAHICLFNADGETEFRLSKSNDIYVPSGVDSE